jgi:hypothetical protein
VSEIVVHRIDGKGLPVRTRGAVAEPIDARVTRLLGLALPADFGPVSEVGFTAQLGAMAAASKAALAADLTCYLAWCDDTRVVPLPAEPEVYKLDQFPKGTASCKRAHTLYPECKRKKKM